MQALIFCLLSTA